MAIPGVGVFNCYDGIAGVAFDDALVGHAQQTTNKHLSSVGRKRQAKGLLTTETMEKFQLAEVGFAYPERLRRRRLRRQVHVGPARRQAAPRARPQDQARPAQPRPLLQAAHRQPQLRQPLRQLQQVQKTHALPRPVPQPLRSHHPPLRQRQHGLQQPETQHRGSRPSHARPGPQPPLDPLPEPHPPAHLAEDTRCSRQKHHEEENR